MKIAIIINWNSPTAEVITAVLATVGMLLKRYLSQEKSLLKPFAATDQSLYKMLFLRSVRVLSRVAKLKVYPRATK